MPGVRHVLAVGDSAVAVVADTWWQAKTALDALPDRLGRGPERQGLERDDRRDAEGRPRRRPGLRGQPERRRQGRHRRRGQEGRGGLRVSVPEPRADGADERHGALHARTAARSGCRRRTARPRFAATLAASGLPADKCEVYKINLGGGFGRRGAFHDYVTQAVLIAKQMPGTPVKLLWSREEDMLHGRYHPVMQCKLVGALDARGNLTGLHMRLSGQSILDRRAARGPPGGQGPARRSRG